MFQAIFKRSSLLKRVHPKLFGPDMRKTILFLVVGFSGVFFFSAPASAEFIELDPGFTNGGSWVWGISGDGHTALGNVRISGYDNAYLWSEFGGEMNLGFLPGGNSSRAIAASADGSVVVGHSSSSAYIVEAFRWTQDGGMVGLGTLGADYTTSRALGVSADGTVIVGWGRNNVASRNEPFRWVLGDGMSPIFLPNSSFGDSYANAVSGDGNVVVGSSFDSGTEYAWRATYGTPYTPQPLLLGQLPGGTWSRALGISADGNTVVGSANDADGQIAVKWVGNYMDGYTVTSLPRMINGATEAKDASADGSVIVGWAREVLPSTGNLSDQAVRWDDGGITTIKDWVEFNTDITIDWVVLSQANGVSDDGTTVVGYGWNAASQYEAYVARVAVSAPPTTTTSTTTTTLPTTTTSTTTTTTQPPTSTTTTTLPPSGFIGVTDFTNSLGDVHKGRALGHKINTLMGRTVSNFASSSPGAISGYLHGKSIISPVFAYGEGSETIMAGVAAEHAYDTVAVKVALAGVDAEDDGRYNGNVELSGYSFGIAVDMYPGKMAKSSAMEPLNITIGYDHGFYEGDFDRSYLNGATPEISNGEPDVDSMSAYIKAGWRFAFSEIASIRPYVELYYQKTEMDSYTETGGSFPGTVTSQDESNTRYSFGLEGDLQISDRFKVGADVVSVRLRDDQGPDLTVSVPSIGVFVYPGVKYDDVWAEFALNSQWNFTDDLWISGEIRGTTGSDYPGDWSARIGLSYVF